jgi:hypothetical protein
MSASGIRTLIANSCTRWHGIFKGLSQDGGRADFSKALLAFLFNNDLSNEPSFTKIHLLGQYILAICLDTLQSELVYRNASWKVSKVLSEYRPGMPLAGFIN